MNQQPSPQPHGYTTPAGTEPTPATTATSAAETTVSFLIPLDAAGRHDLLDALRIAADAILKDLRCPACAALMCDLEAHGLRLQRLRAWHVLTAQIGRLPGIADDEPMIRFDPGGCRAWLQAWAAQDAGIDEGFNSREYAIAAGLEYLLQRVNDEPPQPGWQTVAHLQDVQIWQAADSDGVDGGGILTADLNYMGQRVRLASLHQGSDEFTDDPATSGIDAAVQALGHVADTLNREYANLRRATGCPSADGDVGTADNSYTVVGVWVEDRPVPVGVIEGDHQVSGGDDYEHFPQGVWATSVTADDNLAAQRDAIDQMRTESQ